MMSMLRTTTADRIRKGVDQGMNSAHASLTVAGQNIRARLATTGRNRRSDRTRGVHHVDPARYIATPHGTSGPCTSRDPARAARETQALETADRAAAEWRGRHPHRGVPTATDAPRLGDNPLVATDGAGISHIMVTGTFDRLRFVRARGKAVERKCDPRGISGGRTFKHANWLDMKHIMLWHASAVVVHQCGPYTVLW